MTSLAAFIREGRVRTGQVRAVLAELSRQATPVLVTGRRYSSGRPMPDALVSADPSRVGAWRVTWFTGDAAAGGGHVEADTLFDGLVAAWRPGATLTQMSAASAPVTVLADESKETAA